MITLLPLAPNQTEEFKLVDGEPTLAVRVVKDANGKIINQQTQTYTQSDVADLLTRINAANAVFIAQ